jgi:DNA polymerase III delta subunit
VTMKNGLTIWAMVSAETPWTDWWTALSVEMKWPKNIVVEKWRAADFQWSQVVDSFHTFTLFKQNKVIVILEADKALKSVKDPAALLETFKKGPHFMIFQSEQKAPKDLEIATWTFEDETAKEEVDDRVSFKWIDAIHAGNLSGAVLYLEQAVKNDQHPLALLQLLTRDFRMGRLIHHAHQSRLRESEMTATLKVHGFIIQKWLKRPQAGNQHWSSVFERLLQADLEMKSGADAIWVLRKLTLDLIQMTTALKAADKKIYAKFRRPLKPAPQLWTILPSFA